MFSGRVKASKALCLYFLIAAIAAAGISMYLISGSEWGIPIETVSTDIATARRILRFKNIVSPHSDYETTLKVLGKQYRRLRGDPPYYLEIPGAKTIVFVTDEEKFPYSARFHILDLETSNEILLDACGSSFGRNIGSGRSAGAKFSDSVEKVSDNRLTLAVRSESWKEIITLDLLAQKVVSIEILYYDSADRVTNRVVRVKE